MIMDYTYGLDGTAIVIPSTGDMRRTAAFYQSPTGMSRHFASFASGESTRTDDLIGAIHLEIENVLEDWTNRSESESRNMASDLSRMLVWAAMYFSFGFETV